MKKEQIRQLLFDRYIKPTQRKKKEYIGVEIEMPIANLDKKSVDFAVVHSITDSFIKQFSFKASSLDDEGSIIAATGENGDILSYDCSYNNLELSFGKETELFKIKERFQEYFGFLQGEFQKHNYALTGMGVNPYRIYNRNVPIPNGRYRMLFHHLGSYKKYSRLPMYFHNYPQYGTFSSASQVQLDVEYDDLTKTINTFSRLEPYKALLFSNSVLLDEHEELLCCRDMMWENSTHGINPHNIGMYCCQFKNPDELLSYLTTSSMYCVERGEKYINFAPVEVLDYFRQTEIRGEYFDGREYKEITFKPQKEDIKYLRTFKFEDVTFRGTIEFRSVCCQPIRDSLTVAAFHLGLIDNLDKTAAFLESDTVLYHQGYNACELRKMLVKSELPHFVDEDRLYENAKAIVDLAAEGLKKRGLGEETLLAPLYERIKLKTNPAKKLLELKNSGIDMNDIILEFAKL